MYTTRPVNATSSTAARNVATVPIASMATSGPRPSVISTNRSCSGSRAVLIVSCPPANRASSSFWSSTSIQIVRACRELAPATTPSPTPPQPQIATVSLAVTRPRATAWNPTVIGSTRHNSFRLNLAGYSFSRGSTMNSVSAPSLCTPRVWLNWQAFGRPRRQEEHWPQFVYGDTVTFVPVANAPSRPLSSTTVADTSWPRMRVYVTSGLSPRYEFRSLPQNPTKRTFSNTFVSVSTGSARVSRSAWPGLRSTSALMSVLRGK